MFLMRRRSGHRPGRLLQLPFMNARNINSLQSYPSSTMSMTSCPSTSKSRNKNYVSTWKPTLISMTSSTSMRKIDVIQFPSHYLYY